MNFGGPALGIIGCRGELIATSRPIDWHDNNPRRKGESVQHGPSNQGTAHSSEKATSNICTNEALFAIGAAAYLSLFRPPRSPSTLEYSRQDELCDQDAQRDTGRLGAPIHGPHYQESSSLQNPGELWPD